MVEVDIQYNPFCPHCEALRKSLLPVLRRTGVTIEEHLIGGHSISAFEEDYASPTYQEEWIANFGSKEIKKKMKEYSSVLEHIRGGVQFPILRLSWYDGVARRELIVKGFPTDTESQEAKDFTKHFLELVGMVQKVEEEGREL